MRNRAIIAQLQAVDADMVDKPDEMTRRRNEDELRQLRQWSTEAARRADVDSRDDAEQDDTG